MRNRCALSFFVVLVVGMGCAKSDSGIYHVSGRVTHHSQPVPTGFIFFDPDTSKQNRGPQGFALIKAGKFTTDSEYGRGVVGGPHHMRVGGFDGQGVNEMQPYGQRLFPDHFESRDLPKQDCEIVIEIEPSP